MSYIPVYSTRINWENEPSIVSPINATNLNKMDYALKAHDDTFANWDITKANESDLLLALKEVSYDTDTGVFVFEWFNGTTTTIDLNIEKIPVSFSMDANGVITMTTEDGTTYTADVGALIKTYTFTDSSVIDFTVTTDASGNKTVTADIVNGSIDGTKLTPNYLADCTQAKTGAETAATNSEASSQDAEAWAVGTRGGVPVPSTDPAYENNAEYWAHHTSSSLAGLTDTDINNPSDGEVLKYNGATSKWENGQAAAGGGSTIVVTTSESALYGQNITITDGVTTLTGAFDNTGHATFSGVTMTGNLTIACGTASTSLNVPYFGNYTAVVSSFSASITVTYPGGTCTCVGNGESYTASSSPYTFTVHGAATYTITVTIDGVSKTDTVVITTDGQTASITIEYGTINVTYDNAFRGTSITCVQGGTTITKTAPSGANTMTFYPPTTGNWVISGTVSGTPYSKTANVTSLSTSVSVSLETVPDGKTATPTDDIEKWLACGQITGKSYTTLSQVLADAETYERLLSDSNACDYMARSTTWASTICADADAMMRLGKYDYACDALLADSTWCTAICGSTYFEYVLDVSVPTMTSNTAPSGTVVFSSEYNDSALKGYKAFDNDSSTRWCCSAVGSTITNEFIGYLFTEPKLIKAYSIDFSDSSVVSVTYNIEGYDGTNWIPIASNLTNMHVSGGVLDNNTSYQGFRCFIQTETNISSGYAGGNVIKLQFYGRHTAQTDIIVTAHGGDTVYYMENGSPVTLTTADSSTGIGTVDWSDLPKGAITLYSSTAKNPSDLTADYSKTVYVTENTTQIYLMPYEPVLYWWGYIGNNFEEISSANGWSWTGLTLVSTTFRTNDILFNGPEGKLAGCGTKNKVQPTKIHTITAGYTYTEDPGSCAFPTSKSVTAQNQLWASPVGAFSGGTMTSREFTPALSDSGYLTITSSNGRAMYLYALWYE